MMGAVAWERTGGGANWHVWVPGDESGFRVAASIEDAKAEAEADLERRVRTLSKVALEVLGRLEAMMAADDEAARVRHVEGARHGHG